MDASETCLSIGPFSLDIRYDYLLLILFWLIAVGARALMLKLFWPVMTRLEGMDQYAALDWRDAIVMCWGGLRGAVGLALAIDVEQKLGTVQVVSGS